MQQLFLPFCSHNITIRMMWMQILSPYDHDPPKKSCHKILNSFFKYMYSVETTYLE